MKEYICEVVPVYVRPQPVTDEKACVGIIVRCPETNFTAYQFAEETSASFARIVNFFPRFGRENLLRAIAWSKSDIDYSTGGESRDVTEKRFDNLIRPRENVVQYGAPQIQVTQDPIAEVDRIYHALVA